MKHVFSHRNTRYTAIVVLFVWLMTLGIGIANACLVSNEHGHTSATHHVPVTTQAEEHHAPDADAHKAICLKVCAAEQATALKVKPVSTSVDAPMALLAWAPALTIAFIDPNDRLAPLAVPTWREAPMSIRFLRLTI